MALPLIIAAGSAGALLWETVTDFLSGDEPTQVINVQPGATVNAGQSDDVSLGSPLMLAGLALGAWFLFGRQ